MRSRVLSTIAIACRPLPFGACPHHALDRLCGREGIDVVEDTVLQSPSKHFDERFEHLGVCGLNQAGGGEHL